MSEKRNKRICFAYDVFFGAFTVVFGALLIAQALKLFFQFSATEGAIFTRERVADALSPLAVPGVLWIVAAIAAFVLRELFPFKPSAVRLGNGYALYRLKKRMTERPQGELSDARRAVLREERILTVIRLFCLAVCAATAVYMIVYLSMPSHFPKTDVVGEVRDLVFHVFPWIALSFALCLGAAAYSEYSAKKQLPFVRQLTAGVAAERSPSGVFAALQGARFRLAVRIAIGVLGVTLVIVGICNGDMRAMLIKAINICTECIGLG